MIFMKNKIFKFIIGLAIFGMPLAACGSSSGNNQPSVDPTPTPTPTPTPIDPDPKTVTDRDAFLEAASKVRDPGYKSAEVTYRNSSYAKSVSCEGQFANGNDGWRYYGNNPGGDTGSAINEALEMLYVRAAQITYLETIWGDVDDATRSYYMDATGFKFVTTMRTAFEGVNYEGNLEAIFDSYGYLVKATETVNGRTSVTSETLMDMAFHATYSTKELAPDPGPGPQPPQPGDKKEIDEKTFFEYADKYTSLESNYRSAYVKLQEADTVDVFVNAELYLARDIDTGRWSFHHGDRTEADLVLTYISLTASNVTESIIQFTETHFYIDTNGYLYFTGVQETNRWYVTYNLSFDRYGFVTVFDGRAVHDTDEEIILITVTYSTEDLGPVPGPGPSPEGNITEDQWMEWAYSVKNIDAGYRNATVDIAQISDGMGYKSEVVLYSHTGVHSDWHFYDGDKNIAETALNYVALSPDQLTSASFGGDISYNKNGDGSFTAYVHMEASDFTLDAEFKFDANGYITYLDIVNDLSTGDIEVYIDIYYGTEDFPDPVVPGDYDSTIRAREDWTAFAQGGDPTIGWTIEEGTVMSASSVNEVSLYDEELADKLQANLSNIEYIYVGRIKMGTEDAGWISQIVRDGEVETIDGSLTIKGHIAEIDSLGSVIDDEWIPDQSSKHAENLTPETLFMPNWSYNPDEYGITWDTNPAAYERGEYMFVLVGYYTSGSSTSYSNGMGLIKVGDLDPIPEPPIPEEGNMSRAEWIEYANSVEDIHLDYKSATLEGYYFVTNEFSYSGVCYFDNEGTAESPSWVYNSGEKEIASAAISQNVLLGRPSQLIPPDSWDEGKVIYNSLEDGYYRVDVILSEEQSAYVIFDENGYVNEYFVYQTYDEQEMRFFAKVEFSYEPLTPVDPQPETGYGLMVNGVTYPMTVNPFNDSEYMALGVKVHTGDIVKFYNYEAQESWVITNLDSASQGFVVTDTGLYCQDTGRYDFYLKLSWGNDQVYVGYMNVEDYQVGELSFDEFKAAADSRNPMYHPYDYCDCEYTVGSTVYNATFVWDEESMAWKFYDGNKECPNPEGSDIQSFVSGAASMIEGGFTSSFYSDGTIIRVSLSYMSYFSFDVSWNLYGLMTYYHTEGMGEDPSTIIFTYYNLI